MGVIESRPTSYATRYSAPNLDMERWVFLPFLHVFRIISLEIQV